MLGYHFVFKFMPGLISGVFNSLRNKEDKHYDETIKTIK